MRPLSPEFELAAACCRWPPSEGRDRTVRRAAAAGVDWGLFLRITARHRVKGLVWQALKDAAVVPPDEVARDLRAGAAKIARQNVQIATEAVQLRAVFEEAGIPILFIKGVTLSKLAYQNISLKMGWDMDILISPAALAPAAKLLRGRGYELVDPVFRAGEEALHIWHGLSKESVWSSDTRDICLELHTRLVDNESLLRGVDHASPRQWVPISNAQALPTLAADQLFAYLCVHGASSGWFRLKWIADLGALLASSPPAEIERLYRRSQEFGAGRAAAQALLLCALLFETPVDAALMAELRADRLNRWLFRAALRKLSGRSVATELRHIRLGTASIHAMQFALLPGWTYRISELRRQLFNPYDRIAVPLPRRLHFLYPAIFVLRRLRWKRT